MRTFVGGWIVVSLLGGSACALSLATGNLATFFFFAACTLLLTVACAAVGGLVHMACGGKEEVGEETRKSRSRVPQLHRIRDGIEVIETRP